MFTALIPVSSQLGSWSYRFHGPSLTSKLRRIEQSSQWDGLRHFSQTVPGQTDRVFYGGTTVEEINDRGNDRIGLQHWAKEGIAGMIP